MNLVDFEGLIKVVVVAVVESPFGIGILDNLAGFGRADHKWASQCGLEI